MKQLTGLIIALLLPMATIAQSKAVAEFQDKYSSDRDATYITISGSLFNFLSSISDYDDDPDVQAFGRIADGIRSMEILQVPYYESDLRKEEVEALRKSIAKEKFEEFLQVKEGREKVSILAQGEESEIRNMLILIDNKDEFTLLSINGVLSMKDLAYISKNHTNFH